MKTSKKKLPQSTPESRKKAKEDWKKRNMSGAGPRRDTKIRKALENELKNNKSRQPV